MSTIETETTTPLTFGSTFTLPFTGDGIWSIRDLRPRDIEAGEGATIAVATLSGGLLQLDYAPELGGWKPGHIFFDAEDRAEVLEQVRALPVNMAHRTAAEWLAVYKERVESTLRLDIEESDVEWTLDRLAESDVIDHREVRAHAAAAAAVKLAGAGAQGGLFEAVYAATMDALAPNGKR